MDRIPPFLVGLTSTCLFPVVTLAQPVEPQKVEQAKPVCVQDRVTRELRCTTPPPKEGASEAPMEPVSKSPNSSRVYYPNCGAAWRAGVAPIYRGQPGYRVELDGDFDGIACEPVRNRNRR